MGRRRRRPDKTRQKEYVYEYRCTRCPSLFSTLKRGLKICNKCGGLLEHIGKYPKMEGQSFKYPGRGKWKTPEDLYKLR